MSKYILNAFPLELENCSFSDIGVLEIIPKRRLPFLRAIVLKHTTLSDVKLGIDFDVRLSADRKRSYVFYAKGDTRVLELVREINERFRQTAGGYLWEIHETHYNPKYHANPLALTIHDALIRALKARGWLFFDNHRAFSIDREHEDVPYYIENAPLARVFAGVKLYIYAIDVMPSIIRRKVEKRHVVILDVWHHIEPGISLTDIINCSRERNIQAFLSISDYVVDFCPVLECSKKYEGECPLNLRARLRLRRVKDFAVKRRESLKEPACKMIYEYMRRDVIDPYDLLLERYEKRGLRWYLCETHMLSDFVSFEPRPEVIDQIARKLLALRPESYTFTKYMKICSFHIKEDGSLERKASYKRYLAIQEIAEYLCNEITINLFNRLKMALRDRPIEILI